MAGRSTSFEIIRWLRESNVQLHGESATAVNVLHKLDRASRHTAAPNAIRATIRIFGPRSEITTRDIACIIRLLFENP
jgi:hypothetical protein